MNNHPEYPYLSMEAGRVQALLDGWNRRDVAAIATAQEFADEFYYAEFIADPAPSGRDDDLDRALIERMAKAHWADARNG